MSPSIRAFQSLIWNYYRRHARPMPWRESSDPYHIYLSEVMLQQTQVARVLPRYLQYIKRYPTITEVAQAPLSQLLQMWQGLGYNRRAINMGRACRLMATHHSGRIPQRRKELLALPGVGVATAGAILVYAFGQRAPFIETNIRRLFIHFFFAERPLTDSIADSEIMPLIEKSLPRRKLRHWFYALTDYGAKLARKSPNPNRRAQAYRQQPPFAGSHRALRGAIIRYVLQEKALSRSLLCEHLPAYGTAQIEQALAELAAEGMITEDSTIRPGE